MYMTIALRKEVDSVEEAQGLFEFVCDKLKLHPAVQVTGSVSENLELEPVPE